MGSEAVSALPVPLTPSPPPLPTIDDILLMIVKVHIPTLGPVASFCELR